MHGAKHGVGVVECQLEQAQDALPTDGAHAGSAAENAHHHVRAGRCAIKRVTSHAHFQLEVTDDEDDRSHNSKQSGDADLASLRGDVAHRRAVTRQESTSSMKSCSSFGSAAAPPGDAWGGIGGVPGDVGLSHAKSFMKRVVSRRCIDGVPLDELASQIAANGGGSAMADEVEEGNEEEACEAQMDTQAVLRYEEDLTAASGEYYSGLNRSDSCPGRQAEADASPDITPKDTPIHSPNLPMTDSCLESGRMPPWSGGLDEVVMQLAAEGGEGDSTSSGALTPEETPVTAAEA